MSNLLYEKYHSVTRIQKKIIAKNNFTYRNLFWILNENSLLNGDKKVLDIGCGVGTVSLYLASKGSKVLGVDISKRAIDTAISSAEFLSLNNNARFVSGKFQTIKVKGKYDLILMTEVLEHLKDDRKVLNYVKNYLKDDGLLLLSVPSKNAPLYRLNMLKGFDERVGHLRRYTLGDLSELLLDRKMNILRTYKTEGILRNFLFTNRFAGNIIRFLKGSLSDTFAFIDTLTIPLFGESQIYILSSKK